MEHRVLSTVDDVTLSRRGYTFKGSMLLYPYHLVFNLSSTTSSSSAQTSGLKEIWICYPIIERIVRSRGVPWMNQSRSNGNSSNNFAPSDDDFKSFAASYIRLHCKDFTYYSFGFADDSICMEVFETISSLITTPKLKKDISLLYAFGYKPNMMEENLAIKGWAIYDPIKEYERLGLLNDSNYWRTTNINEDYKFCPSYPRTLVVPSSISDNVLKHAGKFRSKQRIPCVVYKHRSSKNGNVIARCSQPLVGLNLQNRSIQDEKLIGEIFKSQERERMETLSTDDDLKDQPHKNLIVDLRPVRNAMAQHALGAGTENIDNYRGHHPKEGNKPGSLDNANSDKGYENSNLNQVDKIFCNIDNIHVMRDSLNKLSTILNDLDKMPLKTASNNKQYSAALQQSLSKTQWLHRISLILQSVDRITKSIHLNNTNVIIHCSDGWDRTSQVSALSQLCLDPFYRTMDGFATLVEKEWISFGFKFATRSDHMGCIGASISKNTNTSISTNRKLDSSSIASLDSESNEQVGFNSEGSKSVTSFLQRAANHIKSTAVAASNSTQSLGEGEKSESSRGFTSGYSGSSDKSPIFHQFLDCVYQLYRQNPSSFEFNSRFLKRLFYHSYSCQYGSFLCDSEREVYLQYKLPDTTVSVWDYFRSRPREFANKNYKKDDANDEVIFFNYTDVKWWYELYGRSDEEMNGLSNSLDKKFAQMQLKIET